MSNLFSLKVITSNRIFFSGKAVSVTVPAIDGEKAFMASHEEMAMALVPGLIRIRLEDNSVIEAVISEGFVDFANNRANIIVFSAEKPEDIDKIRAQEEYEKAEDEFRQRQSMVEYKLGQAEMSRAMVRLAHAGDSKISRTDL